MVKDFSYPIIFNTLFFRFFMTISLFLAGLLCGSTGCHHQVDDAVIATTIPDEIAEALTQKIISPDDARRIMSKLTDNNRQNLGLSISKALIRENKVSIDDLIALDIRELEKIASIVWDQPNENKDAYNALATTFWDNDNFHNITLHDLLIIEPHHVQRLQNILDYVARFYDIAHEFCYGCVIKKIVFLSDKKCTALLNIKTSYGVKYFIESLLVEKRDVRNELMALIKKGIDEAIYEKDQLAYNMLYDALILSKESDLLTKKYVNELTREQISNLNMLVMNPYIFDAYERKAIALAELLVMPHHTVEAFQSNYIQQSLKDNVFLVEEVITLLSKFNKELFCFATVTGDLTLDFDFPYQLSLEELQKSLSLLRNNFSFDDMVGMLDGSLESHAAITIQAHFRGFIDRKELKEKNEFDIKTMVNRQYGQEYFFDAAKQIHHVKMPENAVLDDISGGFKKVTRQDENYIALQHVTGNFFCADKAVAHKKTLAALSGYPSMILPLVISPDMMIAPNGGDDVCRSMFLQKKVLKIAQYRQACEDMEDAHAKGIVFRDIKNLNFVLKGNGMVRFIDLDSVETPMMGYINGFDGTSKYTTRMLAKGKHLNNPVLIKIADQYAMLLAMIEATDFDLAVIIICHYGAYGNGVLDKGNEAMFKTWIERHIQSSYRDHIRDFLENPAVNPLPIALHLMIDWQA